MAELSKFKTFKDILKFAIAREVTSSEFYQKMADNLPESNLQQFFLSFVEEEKQHKSRLQLELIKQGYVVDDAELDLEVDRVPFDPVFLREYQEALRIAVERENVSFRTYVELAGNVKETALKEVFLQLAEEESRHKFIFQRELDALSSR